MIYEIFKIKKELRNYVKYTGKDNVKIKGFRTIKIYYNNRLIYNTHFFLPEKKYLFDFIEYCKRQIIFYL